MENVIIMAQARIQDCNKIMKGRYNFVGQGTGWRNKVDLEGKRKWGCELDSSVSGEGLLASSYKHNNGAKNLLAVKVIINF